MVQSGDTLSEIAQKQLGSSKRWTEIQQLNGGIDPSKIYVGLELRLPSGAAAVAATPTTSQASTSTKNPRSTPTARGSSTTYVVRRGDMLSAIAQKQLGSAKRWQEIAALNPQIDPDHVTEGMSLVMPAGASSTAASSTVARADATPRQKNRVR